MRIRKFKNRKRVYYKKEELEDHQVCAWCKERSKQDGLFEYDDYGVLFCSLDCHEQYFSLDI